MVRLTSARPSGARPAAPSRPALPAKMTSSILPPRSDLAPCSPITHASASTTLDLPDPLGPTTAVMPGSKWNVVADAKDLNPLRVRLFRCTRGTPRPRGAHPPRTAGAGCGGTDVGRGRPSLTLPACRAPPALVRALRRAVRADASSGERRLLDLD